MEDNVLFCSLYEVLYKFIDRFKGSKTIVNNGVNKLRIKMNYNIFFLLQVSCDFLH